MNPTRALALVIGVLTLPSCTSNALSRPDAERSLGGTPLELISAAESAIGATAFAVISSMEVRASGEALYVGQGLSPQQATRERAAEWEVILDRRTGRFERRDRQFSENGEIAWCSARGGDETHSYSYDCVTRDLDISTQRTGADEIAAWESSLPFGWLRLARRQAEDAQVISDPGDPIVLELAMGNRTVVFELDSRNLLRRVLWDAAGELGQTVTRSAEFNDYRTVGEFLFPYSIAYPHPGGHGDSLRVEYIRLGPQLHDSMGRPPAEGVVTSTSPDTTVIVELGGGLTVVRELFPGYNAAFVDTDDGIVVLDAPVGPAAGERLLTIIGERTAGRRVAYVVPTHFHHDHLAGLRPFVDQGAVVIATPGVAPLVAELVAGGLPGLRQAAREPRVEVLHEPREIGTGDRRVVLYPVSAAPHVDEMILPWVPSTRSLYVADLFSRESSGRVRPMDEETVGLLSTLGSLNLSPQIVVPAHGAISNMAHVRRIGSAIDRFVEHAMAELDLVPGLALAVVADGRLVHERGYGYADLETGRHVTPETVFYTASLGKAFTGMTAAVLAAQGRIDLDAPLNGFFPALSADAPVRAGEVRLRDLLSHNKGFTNSGLNFLTTFVRPVHGEELVRLLNSYSSSAPGFVYSNSSFFLADEILEHVTGEAWQDLMDDLVFDPLEMTRSTAWVKGVDEAAFALPYLATADGFREIPFLKSDSTITGAGGIFSTARDLSAFVLANLQHGRFHGLQALPAEAVREAHAPQVELSASFFEFERYAYGLGFYLARWEDELLVHHFGGYPGYRSHVSFMPDRGLGVVVLQNEGVLGNRVADIVAAYAYDLLQGRNADVRGAERLEGFRRQADQRRQATRDWDAELRILKSQPQPLPLPVTQYAGIYVNDRLGALRVIAQDETLRLEWGDLPGVLYSAGGNDFVVEWFFNLMTGSPARFSFLRSGNEITGFTWDDRRFERASSGR